MRRPASLIVAVSAERVRSPVAAARLAAVARLVLRAQHVRAALVSVTLLSAAQIAKLNSRHLNRRGRTDVIAFAFTDGRAGAVPLIVGDVYIAPAVARANARRLGVPLREEVVRLVVHGVLHVLGHDHPDGEARERSAMWRRQERLVRSALGGRAA